VIRKASVGLASDLESSRARAQLEATRATVPPQRAAVRGAAYRLSVLVGLAPAALLETLLVEQPIPDPPDLVPLGLPSDLLRRRPDLLAAERQLHASTAGIGVATADLYPRFFLTGGVSLESGSFSDLFESASRAGSLGPSLSWPVFQGGRIRARIEAAEARQDIARLRFEQTLLVALEDVERALVGYGETRLARDRLADATANAPGPDPAPRGQPGDLRRSAHAPG
jgi:outer membrane protein TolC